MAHAVPPHERSAMRAYIRAGRPGAWVGRFAGEVKSGDFLVRLRRAGCMEDMVGTRLEIATCPPFPFHASVILACSVLRVEAVSTPPGAFSNNVHLRIP